jgi:hypothetical protein
MGGFEIAQYAIIFQIENHAQQSFLYQNQQKMLKEL